LISKPELQTEKKSRGTGYFVLRKFIARTTKIGALIGRRFCIIFGLFIEMILIASY